MDFRKGLPYLTEKDLDSHPIWVERGEEDYYYPVYGPDDFPEDDRCLQIKAEFTSPNNMKFKGAIAGLFDIICIKIFIKNDIYYFNYNMEEDNLEYLSEINKHLNTNMTPKDFSPLKYTTKIDLENFKNVSGEFVVFGKDKSNIIYG